MINFLKRLDYDNLSHKLLSYKVAALLTILSGQRVSTVHKFRLSQLHITKDIAIFTIPSLLKHTKPGRVNLPVTFHKYPYDDLLCPVMLLNRYISYRESLSLGDTDELIITFGKPYHPASKDTIARWIKDLMRISGVDTEIFKPHSCRSASTSKHTFLVFLLIIYSNADSGVLIVHFTNFIVGTLTVMITQEVPNFLIAFCLQLIVHNTFGERDCVVVLIILICACFCLVFAYLTVSVFPHSSP